MAHLLRAGGRLLDWRRLLRRFGPHWRVLFQYKPGTPQADIAKLRKLDEEKINGSAGYHALLFRNNTNMPARFAAVAWTKSLTCDRLTSQSMDAMREFRKAYTDKGPEFIP